MQRTVCSPARRTVARTIPVATLALAFAALPAHAQNALGDGTALDRSLQVGSGGINRPVKNFAADLAFRNAIVTGNVTGGLGFRGEVGYTGAFDFRGITASDTLFDFQARSFSSADVLNFQSPQGNPALAPSLRGLGATQRSLGWGVAGQFPSTSPGNQIIDRSFAGTSVMMIDQSIRDPLGGAAGITVDEFPRMQGAIRSTSDLIARSGSEIARLGIIESPQEGTRALRVSSDLLSVRDLPLRQRNAIDGVPLAPSPELLSGWRDPSTGLFPTPPTSPADPFGRESDTPAIVPIDALDPTRSADDPPADPLSNRIPTNRLTPEASPYHRAMDSLRVRNERIAVQTIAPIHATDPLVRPQPADQPTRAAEPTWVLTLEQRLDAIRAAMAEQEAITPNDPRERVQDILETAESLARIEDLRAELRDLSPEQRERRLRDPEVAAMLARPPVVARIARETLSDTGVVIRSLAARPATEQERSIFDRHMLRGQELLAAGSFFAAEERFTAALFIVPGEPLAVAGRLHAQIGAGMYRSATLNLRNLLRSNPELAAVRFDPALLPSGERLEITLNRLREFTDPATLMNQEAGLLLAYLGHQFQNAADIQRGINAARQFAAETDRPLDPMVEILAAIWLGDLDEHSSTRDPSAPAKPAPDR